MTVKCQSCQKRFEVPDVYRGRVVKCPKCKASTTATEKPTSPPKLAVTNAVDPRLAIAGVKTDVAASDDEQLPVFEAVDPLIGERSTAFSRMAYGLAIATVAGYCIPPLNFLLIITGFSSLVLGLYAAGFIAIRWRLVIAQQEPFRKRAIVGVCGLLLIQLLHICMLVAMALDEKSGRH